MLSGDPSVGQEPVAHGKDFLPSPLVGKPQRGDMWALHMNPNNLKIITSECM